MPTESKNVDKGCAFSSLVSSYGHLCVMNDKSKTKLVCERATCNCVRSHCLWGLISHSSCTLVGVLRPHIQPVLDTISCSAYSCSFPMLYTQHEKCVVSYRSIHAELSS